MLTTTLTIMLAGFGLGLLHALDADHVMAISALGNTKPGLARTLRYCLQWAIGHAGVLLISGLCLFGLGLHIPPGLQFVAELAVGVLLIGLGGLFFWQYRQQSLTLSEHSHTLINGDNDVDSAANHNTVITHRHWTIDQPQQASIADAHPRVIDSNKRDNHAPVMVGVIHGLAGSAPALALVPAIAQGQIMAAMAYLLVFSVGVMLSMLIFGFGLGAVQTHLQKQYTRLFHWHRHLIASGSIGIGGYWLLQAL